MDTPWYMDRPSRVLPLTVDKAAKAERKALLREEEQKKRQTQLKSSLGKQLESYDLDLEAWEDQLGFDKITDDLDDLRQASAQLHSQGYNLSAPTTKAEMQLSIAMKKRFSEIQKEADLYSKNKELWKTIGYKIREQGTKPESEREMDVGTTREKLNKILDAKTIEERNKLLNNFDFVTTETEEDIQEYWIDKFDKIAGEKKWITTKEDPATGKKVKTVQKGISDEDWRAGNEQVFDTMPTKHKNQIRRDYKKAIESGEVDRDVSLRDYAIDRYATQVDEEYERSVTYEGKAGGTGPSVDKDGKVIWSTPTNFYKTPYVGDDDSIAYRSAGSIGLGNLFSKTSDRMMIPVKPKTVNTETGEVEVAQNTYQPTIPVMVNFYAVADEDIQIPAYTGKAPTTPRISSAGEQVVIPKGEKIPAEYEFILHQRNMQSGQSKYRFHYEPFVDQKVKFEQINVAGEGDEKEFDVKTWGKSNIVPYFDVREYLMTKSGFVPYDNAIMQKHGELNQAGFTDILGPTSGQGKVVF